MWSLEMIVALNRKGAPLIKRIRKSTKNGKISSGDNVAADIEAARIKSSGHSESSYRGK